MNARARLFVATVFALTGACQHRGQPSEAGAASAAPSSAAPILARTSFSASAALPEDPAAGARSVALWRQHQEQEERERRLNYDRRKTPQHRAVLKTLRAIQQSYDRATNERALLAAEQQLSTQKPQLERAFNAIDHWGVNSKLVPEYRKLIELLSDSYPRARREALAGQTAQLRTLQQGIAERFTAIDDWLREAAYSDDE